MSAPLPPADIFICGPEPESQLLSLFMHLAACCPKHQVKIRLNGSELFLRGGKLSDDAEFRLRLFGAGASQRRWYLMVAIINPGVSPYAHSDFERRIRTCREGGRLIFRTLSASIYDALRPTFE